MNYKTPAYVDEAIHILRPVQQDFTPFASFKVQLGLTAFLVQRERLQSSRPIAVFTMSITPNAAWCHDNGAYLDDLIIWLESGPAASIKPGVGNGRPAEPVISSQTPKKTSGALLGNLLYGRFPDCK